MLEITALNYLLFPVIILHVQGKHKYVNNVSFELCALHTVHEGKLMLLFLQEHIIQTFYTKQHCSAQWRAWSFFDEWLFYLTHPLRSVNWYPMQCHMCAQDYLLCMTEWEVPGMYRVITRMNTKFKHTLQHLYYIISSL